MLNNMNLQSVITPKIGGFIWKQGFVLFARLKNHTVVFTKARKVKMDMLSNARYVDLNKGASIIKNVLKFVLLNMKDGLREIQTKSLSIKGLIITGIKKKSLRSLERAERLMDMLKQSPIEKGIKRRLTTITMLQWQLSLVILSVLNHVRNVKSTVSHMLIIMTTQNPWKLPGYVENVMVKGIELFYQRERLSLETPKGDAIVQTTEETCRGEFEAVPPPSNWSVSNMLLKVIEWLRHTAGCSFYQGQCITNDLWVQNLRSTGI
jgi:hypothetical protein